MRARPPPSSGLADSLRELINDDPTLSVSVQELIDRNPLVLHFRPAIEHCFHLKREQEFSAIFPIAAFLWAALFAMILGSSRLFFDYVWTPGRFPIWQAAFAFTGAMVAVFNLCAWLPRTHRLIHRHAIAPVSVMTLYLLMLGNFAYPDHAFNIHASYNIIIAMILISFSMRLFWQTGTLVLLTAGGLAEMTLLVTHWEADWLQLMHAYVMIGMVLSVIGFFVERRERIGFLHEVLVAVKSGELERLNGHLSTMASKDALCGLANRRAFDELLAREWERGRREEQPLSVIFMDVDYFKRYNDTYGHAAGDECLRQVGRAIRQALLRPGDIAARYGGEEFVILLPNTDLQGAMEVGDRLLSSVDALAIPHHASEAAYHVTVSIGLACLVPSAHASTARLLEEADKALYEAKSRGRHRMACLQPLPAAAFTPDDILLRDLVSLGGRGHKS